MGRQKNETNFDTPTKRAKLPARDEPYWRQLAPGTFIGYRRGLRGSSWRVRHRVGNGYSEKRIGTADDNGLRPDGDMVLSYVQAVVRASSEPVTPPTPSGEKRPAPAYVAHVGGGLTINQAVDHYLETRAKTPGGRTGRVMTPASVIGSRQSWNRHGRSGIGRQLVASTTKAQLRDWHTAISNIPPTTRGKVQPFDKKDPLQVRARQATANRILTIVKAALNMAWKDDKLPPTCRDWWRPVTPHALGDDPEPLMLDDNELQRIINAAPADFRELIYGALFTGARAGELQQCKVGAFDSETGTLRIYQGKTGKTLVQPMTQEGRQFFEHATAGRSSAETLFLRANGRAWSRNDHQRAMNATAKAARVEGATFKCFRASYGKRLLLATRDLEIVAKALGHSDSRITRQHYARYLPSELSRAMLDVPSIGFIPDKKVKRLTEKK